MKFYHRFKKISHQKNVLIVGLGNPLKQDDGVGNFIVAQLVQLPLPPNVKIIDCGTDILKMTSFFDQTDEIILIDAVDTRRSPGTILYFERQELLKLPGKTQTVHFLSLIESLKLLEKISGMRYPLVMNINHVPKGTKPKEVPSCQEKGYHRLSV